MQRSTDGVHFIELAAIPVTASSPANGQYFFADINTPYGRSFYRIVVIKQNLQLVYTKVVEIYKNDNTAVTVLPNPVVDAFTVKFTKAKPGKYIISLLNTESKMILRCNYSVLVTGGSKFIQRPAGLAAGVYYLVVHNTSTGDRQSIKLVFR